MLDLRDMEILTALAQHCHFQRAADACGISQPAFSTRLRNLEKKLGTPLVRRGNRYVGLTPEGEIALLWARRILQDAEGMRQDISAAKDGLSGHVSIGAVPTTVSFAARASILLRKSHPGLTVEIRSASSDQIQRELASFALDVGITYSNRISGSGLQVEHLYEERYVLVAPRSLVEASGDSITWRQAGKIPLCLMSADMNNRKIIDRVFSGIGIEPILALETNAFTAALVQVTAGLAATIVPELLIENLNMPPDLVALPLRDPMISEPIGLATVALDPQVAAVRETLIACRAVL